ncbi:MAG: hypothetical protein HC888_07135 [Candidatus Competibacteraceae bacterium]|nr:hypothetical protein [Candidatus Competibacteraceae bacterium]
MDWKLRAGDYMIPVKVIENDNRLYFHFGFNRSLMGEIKVMQGRQYHGFKDASNHEWVLKTFGTDKIWSVPITPRNLFQLSFLKGGNPYAHYDQPPVEFKLNREEAYQHQRVMVWDGCTYHYCIWAAEMGSGKSLSLIEVMERSGSNDWWYVAPKSAIKSFEQRTRSDGIPKSFPNHDL